MKSNLDNLIDDLYCIMTENKITPSKIKLDVFFLIWFLIIPYILICYGLTIAYAKLWILWLMLFILIIIFLVVSPWTFNSLSTRKTKEEVNEFKLRLWPDGFNSSQDARKELDSLIRMINERIESKNNDRSTIFKAGYIVYSTITIPIYYQVIKKSTINANIGLLTATTAIWVFCVYTVLNFTEIKAMYNYEEYKGEIVVEELKKLRDYL